MWHKSAWIVREQSLHEGRKRSKVAGQQDGEQLGCETRCDHANYMTEQRWTRSWMRSRLDRVILQVCTSLLKIDNPEFLEIPQRQYDGSTRKWPTERLGHAAKVSCVGRRMRQSRRCEDPLWRPVWTKCR
jgi:hypothetical protein